MTAGSDPNVPDAVRSAIQSQHPKIADEIQGAINTLRKLQEIAGPSSDDGSAPVEATAAGSLATPSAAADVGFLTSADDAPEPERPLPVLAANQTFGRYQIVRLLGRGAMGAVYLAYDSQLQRHVALKTPSLGGSPQAVARFLREARAAAQLRSPFVCPVYDVGQVGGVHYLSMAFIDGQPLSKAISERRLGDGKAIAVLARKMARGLQKAHEHGIIHRDLKPDNIMLDSDGEPIVMDFGLARRMDEDTRITQAGRLLGTPAYMSPEQVDGDPDKIGPPTDIYSLGVVLYQMLTGRLPFQGSLTAILRQISSTAPPPPSKVNPALGEGTALEQICLKMMARVPAERYSSMAAVVEALEEAFPRERPPEARPSLLRRLSSWAGGLFASRPAAPAAPPPAPVATPTPSARPAPAPAASHPDKTLLGSGSVPPAERTPQGGDQTIDLPQSHDSATAAGASPNQHSGDQTMDLPQSHDGGTATAASLDQQHSGDQTMDLPQSHDSLGEQTQA
jgi:serine/threonine protein kinase